MRRITNFQETQIVINDILDWREKLETRANDMHGLRIANLGPATSDGDAVTLGQVREIIAQLRADIRNGKV